MAFAIHYPDTGFGSVSLVVGCSNFRLLVRRAKALTRAANRFVETGFTRYSSAPWFKAFSTMPG